MNYRILADIVVVVHFFWILFLFLGAFWGRKSKAVRIVHLSGLFFALFIQVFGWYCPLTHLEVWLRSRHAPGLAYTGAFIAYYVQRVVYLELPHLLVFVLTLLLVGLNALLYLRRKK
jgi:hypothetical protein